jgi:hypothetical protein
LANANSKENIRLSWCSFFSFLSSVRRSPPLLLCLLNPLLLCAMRRSRQQELQILEAAIQASQEWLEAGCPENFFSQHMLHLEMGQMAQHLRLRLFATAEPGVYHMVASSRIRVLGRGQLEAFAAGVPSSPPAREGISDLVVEREDGISTPATHKTQSARETTISGIGRRYQL